MPLTWRPGGRGRGSCWKSWCSAGPREGSAGGCRSVLLAPSLAPSAPRVPGIPRDIREDPRLPQAVTALFWSPPSCTASGCLYRLRGDPSRPGVLNDAPPLGPAALFSLGPHVSSLFTFVAARCLCVPSGEGRFWKTPTRDEGPDPMSLQGSAQGQTQASLQPTDR